ncbi:MAG: TIGR02452 family protein [Lachnospiraceae bacterium]|nr:TIGR02452 family protein [Lachnospiraceae bacterium]
MDRKEQRKDVAVRHTKEMDRLYADAIQKSVKETKLYDTAFSREKGTGQMAEFTLEQSFTQDSIFRNAGNGKVAVLNFASYRHAGGGFIRGAMAQEESICHDSFLYNVIREFTEYYELNEAHLNKGLYQNRALYSPGISFFSKTGKSVSVDVLTCAAPNRSLMFRDGRFTEGENEEALRERICFIRDICDAEGVETFIAGAFGCGVFAQKPDVVATLFREYFSDTGVKKVILAVPADKNYPAFEKEFGK